MADPLSDPAEARRARLRARGWTYCPFAGVNWWRPPGSRVLLTEREAFLSLAREEADEAARDDRRIGRPGR